MVSTDCSFFSKPLNIVKSPPTDLHLADLVDWVDTFPSFWNIYWPMLRAQGKFMDSKLHSG